MANSFSWVKRDSSPLRDMAFCRLDWAVRGLYDALYMLSIDLVQVGAESVSSPLGRAEEIAWHLRTELEFVEWGLGCLEAIGYVAQQDGQWRLTRAEEEQRPSEGSERMAALRKRQKTGRYNTVTNRHNGGDELSRDTDTDTDKVKTIVRKPAKSAGSDGFDEWWEEQARKEGKGAARASYAKALKRTDKQTLLDSWRRSKAAYEREDRSRDKYPLPATWLNQERWADEYDEVRPQRAMRAPCTNPDCINGLIYDRDTDTATKCPDCRGA